jgi:hypothetical protein
MVAVERYVDAGQSLGVVIMDFRAKNIFLVQSSVVALCVLCLATAVSAGDPVAENEYLRQWLFSGKGWPVPAAGIQLKCEQATWTLGSGSVYAMQPTTDGRITGYVFSGQGQLELKLTDPIEVKQLARFSGEPEVDTLRESFTKLVIRTTRDLSTTFPGISAVEPLVENEDFKRRHKDWERSGWVDLNERVLAGLYTPDDDYLLVEMDTERFGWLTFELDPWSLEPVRLLKLREAQDYLEVWVSLKRADGSEGMTGEKRIDLQHIEVEIDLTKHDGREALPGRSREGDLAKLRITVSFTPLVSGPRALQMGLHFWADVKAVTSSDGKPTPFVRAHLGDLYSSIDKDIYDRFLVVVLPTPLVAGEEQSLTVEYEIKMYNYLGGRMWYPTVSESLNDLHTARLTFIHPEKYVVRSLGSQVSSSTEGTVATTVWETARPTKMVGFSFGSGYKEETTQVKDGPEVVVIGKESGTTSGNMIRNVSIDLANSLRFYEWYFDTPLPTRKIYAARIGSFHGQAFEGFIHLSNFTFDMERSGSAELFRAHEAAHQYWGHMVGWKSYRDQWLSEGLAEYSAMIFLEATMAKDNYFEEILDVYFEEQLGGRSKDMSRFSRPWLRLRYQDVRDQLGPIGVGYRASTYRVPSGYSVQAYNKGAMVFHMLRMLLRTATSNDDMFRAVLKDFLQTHTGQAVSTDDFAKILSKHIAGDWSWFFKQWVYSTDIPTYTWDYTVANQAGGQYLLSVTVAQSGVSEGFTMPVPLHVDLGGGKIAKVPLIIKKPEETFSFNLPSRPKKVVLNPEFAVLAKVKKR